ncbi:MULTISPECIES: hypothetical protein [unclassified Aeromicrobium]|uniref:hypothetical protein n=1 Tax=unclassified Aeromicrobium TaxID=2633570 RepID=UPI000ABD0A65|nr:MULTISPECIES: hypothetical protein [unclassified Aeromicrobium]
MPPSAPLTAVTTVTATAVLAGLLAAPSTRPPVLHGASDTSVLPTTQRIDDGSTRTVDTTDPSDERLPLNGDLTPTTPTPAPVYPGGSGWEPIRRSTTQQITIGGVGTVPADAFGARLKISGRWLTKKDAGVLAVRDPELAGDVMWIERPPASSYVSTETFATTLSQDGTIEIQNSSRTDIDVKVEVLGWYTDPDPQSDVGAGVEDGFALIEQIPDAETTTQDDIDAWLADQGLAREESVSDADSTEASPAVFDPRTDRSALATGAAACVRSIVIAVISNIFLVAKLAKVKAAIKAVGGAKKAYRALRKAYKAYRKAGYGRSSSAKYAFRKVFKRDGVGKEAQAVLLEIASVQGVIDNCF